METQLITDMLDQAVSGLIAVLLVLRIEKKLDILIAENTKLIDTIQKVIFNREATLNG